MIEAGPDALVIFGITGDLARQMTFPALCRLEQRGLLPGPVLGVGRREWGDDGLRQRARESIEASAGTPDPAVFDSLASRLAYVQGDLDDADTHDRIRQALDGASTPVFYLETPPALFAPATARLSEAGMLDGGARLLIEKPFGHDLRSARELAGELHEHVDEDQLYRIDHFLGKSGVDELLYLRFANTMLDAAWDRGAVACVQLTLSEQFGLEDRGKFFDPVGAVRDVVVNHLMQLLAAVAIEAPSGADAAALHAAKLALFRSIEDVRPERCVRGQYAGYREIDGVDPDSNTETFIALELAIDNPRWRGVPFLVRTGKRLAATQTEARVVFRQPPGPQFLEPSARRHPVAPPQVVVRVDRSPGVRVVLDVRAADGIEPAPAALELALPDEGGDAPTAYEAVLEAALRGDRRHFTTQANVEECWRIFDPVLDSGEEPDRYAQGSWGPAAARALARDCGGWLGPWLEGGDDAAAA